MNLHVATIASLSAFSDQDLDVAQRVMQAMIDAVEAQRAVAKARDNTQRSD
jgi:hypothetical protein